MEVFNGSLELFQVWMKVLGCTAAAQGAQSQRLSWGTPNRWVTLGRMGFPLFPVGQGLVVGPLGAAVRFGSAPRHGWPGLRSAPHRPGLVSRAEEGSGSRKMLFW